MNVGWNNEDRILMVDDREYYSEGDDYPVEVRVSDLRHLTGKQIPEGVKVMAVRKVVGSLNDFYGDPENAYFCRTRDGSFITVEDAVIVADDDVPDIQERAACLQQELSNVVEHLEIARLAGIILDFEVGDIYDEIAYISFTVAVQDDKRPVYAILHDVPLSAHDLLPVGSPAAVLLALRDAARILVDGTSRKAELIEHLRHLVRVLGYYSGDLVAKFASGDVNVDAVLRPYTSIRPLISFEIRTNPSGMNHKRAILETQQAGEIVGSAASMLFTPSIVAATSHNGLLAFDTATATLLEAQRLLNIVGRDALPAIPKNLDDVPSEDCRYAALQSAITAACAAQTNGEKGNTYEDLACAALALIPGLSIKHRRLLTTTSEIDLLVEYTRKPSYPMFEETGRYVLVECKNWAKPAGAKELRDFFGKLADSRTKLGLYFSRNGVTGEKDRDAIGTIKAKYHQDGVVVVVITFDDLRAVAQGEDFLQLIDRRYDEVRFQLA
ncbi:MAG: hypothetical protein ACTS2F_21875 [Thainema sp.]